MIKYSRIVLLFYLHFVKPSDKWSYNQKAQDWGGTCANGKRQSPIDIEDAVAVGELVPKIEFTNYDKGIGTSLIANNGHTLQLTLNEDEIGDIKVSGDC